MSPQRKIFCHRCWSGYNDVGVLEGVSHWLGYMVFERWYWMIMMLSRRHSKWHCHLECFLVGTYRGWSETFWRTPSFRWQACKTKNPQAKAWEPGWGVCWGVQLGAIFSNFWDGVFEGPSTLAVLVLPVSFAGVNSYGNSNGAQYFEATRPSKDVLAKLIVEVPKWLWVEESCV